MATSKPATKQASAPAKTAAPKVKRPKAASMSMTQRYDLMSMVKNAPANMPDATLAAQATAHFGRPVLQVTIAGYRKQFGIPSVRKPGVKQLHERIAALEQFIRDAEMEVPA